MALLPSAGNADRTVALGNAFVDRARGVASAAELRKLMEDICREIGFRHFALIHHADLRIERPGIININNYPPVWADTFVGQRLYIEDPVVHACLRSNHAFCWRELEAFVRLTARHRAIMDAAAREGLRDGITIPACVLGEPTGSCSLCGPLGEVDPAHCMMLTQFVGAFGFGAARRIAAGGAEYPVAWPRLSPRQRECIVLIGQGKTNWEIANILGIKRATVKDYVEEARILYDVVSRTQLVVCALLAGEIGFIEIAAAQPRHLAG